MTYRHLLPISSNNLRLNLEPISTKTCQSNNNKNTISLIYNSKSYLTITLKHNHLNYNPLFHKVLGKESNL